MKAKGRVFRFGNNIDTDAIIAARYLNTTDGKVLAKHCMEDIAPDFASTVKEGDIIVAGSNFGCGSSREHAPLALKCAGVSCIIAPSFARIFYRNAVNTGLPILECPEAAEAIADGAEVEVDFAAGEIRDLVTGKIYQSQPFPPFIADIIAAGGLLASIKGGK